MTEEDPEGDSPPDEAGDPATDAADSDSAVVEAGTSSAVVPIFRPGGAPLGDVLRMEDVSARFGEEAPEFISRNQGRGFLVRLFGGAYARGQVPATVLGDALTQLGKTGAWFNNALSGFRIEPDVSYAAAVRSVVVQFLSSPEEEIYDEQGRDITATARTGRWMASLTSASEEDIWRAARVLRPRATRSYLKALEEIAGHEGGAEWVLLDENQPQVVQASEGRIIDTIRILEKPVGVVAHVVQVTGVLYAANQYRHRFTMDVSDGELAGKTISGTYSSDASESLEGAWRKRVDALIRVNSPEVEGMPRSPRKSYELVSVTRVRLNESVPPEPASHTREDD